MGQHTANERAVGGSQGHRHPAMADVAEDTGGCAVGFVFGIGGCMQGTLGWRRSVFQQRWQHDAGALLAPMGQQGLGQSICLKALQHHERIHGLPHTGLKQHIGGMPRGRHPFQRQARNQSLVVQAAAFIRSGQEFAGLIAPGRPLRRGTAATAGAS